VSDLEDAYEPELNAAAIVEVLNRYQVRYVIIGAFAAIAQQAPIPATRDIDLTPETGPENLARLSLALNELGANTDRGSTGRAAVQSRCHFAGGGRGVEPDLP